MKPVLTAKNGTNAELFPEVLRIYAREGNRILDMTYGQGVFWKNVDTSRFDLSRNDINTKKGEIHEDFKCTSWRSSLFDIVILDPPYMFGAGGKDSVMDKQYENGMYRQDLNQKGIKAIVNLYEGGIKEVHRILKPRGLLMVKCMDLIQGGHQHRIHHMLFDIAINNMGMIDEDLFILVSNGVPIMRHKYQLHARKNNSFLWVFRK